MASAKVPYRRELGAFPMQQAQIQGQAAAVKTNQNVDTLRVLNNRVYVALATDTGNVAAAAYATLLTANINTTLTRGALLISFSASGVQNTAAGTVFFQVVLDNVVVKGLYVTVPTGYSFNVSMLVQSPVTVGAHRVQLQWKTNVASVRISAKTVVEEHAHLLVQEQAA